ncbi:hypothetical protein FQA39_LY18815 [Lamprigera yunnana]|nr:hypothetical protein FQA39_LY18815 [Lamprigera yunnana]
MDVFIKLLHWCVFVEKDSWTPLNTYTNTHKQMYRKNRDSVAQNNKPDWLKQWTVSKGWMHNRSHLLELGVEKQSAVAKNDNSSVSEDDIEDLLSDANKEDLDKIETVPHTSDYSTAFDNYRNKFPDAHCDIPSPQVYKERLYRNHHKDCIRHFLPDFKCKRKKKKKNKRFLSANANENSGAPTAAKSSKSTLSEDIAFHNVLNAKTNLHEDVIYECSESSASLYNNPIYVSSDVLNADNKKFFDFHTNHTFGPNYFITNKTESLKKNCHKTKTFNRTEKYIIRHIKIRIMLSLRVYTRYFVKTVGQLLPLDVRGGQRSPCYLPHRSGNKNPEHGQVDEAMLKGQQNTIVLTEVREICERIKKAYIQHLRKKIQENWNKYKRERNKVNAELKRIKKDYRERFTKRMNQDMCKSQKIMWGILRRNKTILYKETKTMENLEAGRETNI